MILKKLIEKIIIYFKSLFGVRKFNCEDILYEISSKVWQANNYVKTSEFKNKKPYAEEVLHRLKSVKHNAEMMRYTDKPYTFMSNYTAALENIRLASDVGHIDSTLRMFVDEVKDMLYAMPKSYEQYNGEGLVYYSVTFAGKRKEYYYLSGDKSYKEGQYVIAPAGDYMEPAVVKIVSIENYTRTNAPMPPEFLKTITSPAIKESEKLSRKSLIF